MRLGDMRRPDDRWKMVEWLDDGSSPYHIRTSSIAVFFKGLGGIMDGVPLPSNPREFYLLMNHLGFDESDTYAGGTRDEVPIFMNGTDYHATHFTMMPADNTVVMIHGGDAFNAPTFNSGSKAWFANVEDSIAGTIARIGNHPEDGERTRTWVRETRPDELQSQYGDDMGILVIKEI